MSRSGGRQVAKLDAAQVTLLYQLYNERERAVREICRLLKISKPTLPTIPEGQLHQSPHLVLYQR